MHCAGLRMHAGKVVAGYRGLPAGQVGTGYLIVSPINITGISDKIDGKWQPKTLTWTFSRAGLTVAFRCESSDVAG